MYSSPLNSIAAKRSDAFIDYFPMFNIEIDLITRYFEDNQIKENSFSVLTKGPSNVNLSYIIKNNLFYTGFDDSHTLFLLYKKLPKPISNILAYLCVDITYYGWKKHVLSLYEKELKNNKYNFIIASYGPLIVLDIGRTLSKKYNIPFVADFRDLHLEKIISFWYLRKIQQSYILRNCIGITFVCEGMREAFNLHATKKLKKIPTAIIQNGIDPKQVVKIIKTDEMIINSILQLKQLYQIILLHTGTIYPDQDISFFVDSIDSYNTSQNKFKVCIVFVGLKKDIPIHWRNTSSLYYYQPVSHSSSLFLQKWASALLLPSWPNRYTGFSGKMLEYLYSGNNIICSPNPPDDSKRFLSEFNNVYFTNNDADINNIIDKISEKEFSVDYPNCGDERLSRVYWIEKFAKFLTMIQYNNNL